jgi:mannosyltransferase OCH1-like enzyme
MIHLLSCSILLLFYPWITVSIELLQSQQISQKYLKKFNQSLEHDFIIPSYLPPRSHWIPIRNHYGFSNVCNRHDCGDFHLVLYYLSNHSCWMILRRLDHISWNYNVSIYIENPSDDHHHSFHHEIITIGTSKTFELQRIINTSSLLFLYPDESIYQEQVIPKFIIQTYSSRIPNSIYQWQARKTFEELNPEYTMIMMNDYECRQFLKLYYSSSLIQAYDSLISNTFKSDLFRYAYLIIHGGCYFDHKMIARKPLRQVILSNDTLLVCSDALPSFGQAPNSLQKTTRFYNAIICVRPQDDRLWKTMEYILKRIHHKYSDGSDLGLTGPIAFYNAIIHHIFEDNIRFKHGFKVNSLMSSNRKYEDFYIQEKLKNEIFLTKFYYGFYSNPTTRYGYLWDQHLIYYDILLVMKPWKILIFPGQLRCIQANFTFPATHSSSSLSTSSSSPLSAVIGSNSQSQSSKLRQKQQQQREEYDAQEGILLLSPRQFLTYYELIHEDEAKNNCRLIKLLLIQDDTSEMIKLEIPASDILNAQHQVYRVPFHFQFNR